MLNGEVENFCVMLDRGVNMRADRKKNIVFSEEVDSSINGLAVGISFVVVAIFVISFKIFNNPIAERVIAIILLLIGIVGTMSEIEKIKKNDIKGVGDVIMGLCFAIPSTLGIINNEIILLRAILLPLFLFGVYGFMRGFFEIIYSFKIVKRESKSKKFEIMQIIVTITEVIALFVAILQLISEI